MNTYRTADIIKTFDDEERRLRVYCATNPEAYREVNRGFHEVHDVRFAGPGRQLTEVGRAADTLADRYAYAIKKLQKLEDKEKRNLKLDDAELVTLEALLDDPPDDEEEADDTTAPSRGIGERTRAASSILKSDDAVQRTL